MNRQEAAEVLTALKQRLEMSDDGDYCYYSRDIDAYDTALAALRGPEPDPDTGLVPCGCGGKAKVWPSEPTQFTYVITDYEVGCTECAMTTGWVRGKQENAMNVWNTAMGRRRKN